MRQDESWDDGIPNRSPINESESDQRPPPFHCNAPAGACATAGWKARRHYKYQFSSLSGLTWNGESLSLFCCHEKADIEPCPRSLRPSGRLQLTNDDDSSNQGCRLFEWVGLPDTKYASPRIHINDPDLCVFHAVGTNLLVHVATVWHLCRDKIDRLLSITLASSTPPETRTAHESTCRVPYDIVEIIIAQLIHDVKTLKACSLACRSWNIVTIPYLQHTLTLRSDAPSHTGDALKPPSARDKLRPLSRLHGLGLMPRVKEIRIEQWCGTGSWFVPQAFGRSDLRYFSAFTNVHTLKFRGVEINRFTPRIERYFKHFSPTLRSITLFNPFCTPRQLSHFLSLFSNLDDVEIWYGRGCLSNTPTSDTELVSLSVPSLRGRLALREFRWVETWTDLITLCGGLRFRHMDLSGSTNCTPVLLEACAKTLETLRIKVADGSASKYLCLGLSVNLS